LDIVDIDLSKDGDACDQTQLRHLYTNPYTCVSRKSLGLDKIYILHVDAHWHNNVLACSMSNFSVHLSSIDTLTKINTFTVHEAPIIGVKFSPTDPNVLFTGSNSGSLKVWDVRNPRKPSQELKGIYFVFFSTIRFRQ
jgi:WD40 repeat protein